MEYIVECRLSPRFRFIEDLSIAAKRDWVFFCYSFSLEPVLPVDIRTIAQNAIEETR